jgi:YD repeat-containing protein
MLFKLGWAAFLAVSAVLVQLGPATASTAGGRPIYACFSAQNAAAIGRLGAGNASVRYGFETGECLALAAGVPLNDVERHGNLWRFRVFGAKPYLYAADWAAGFQPADEPIPPGFERYLPVTANLIATGRAYTQCYDDAERLAERFDAHNRRWADYQRSGRSKKDSSTPKMVIYVGDAGPRLAAEGDDLRRQAASLENRCRQVASIEADDDFVAFVRTAQQA